MHHVNAQVEQINFFLNLQLHTPLLCFTYDVRLVEKRQIFSVFLSTEVHY